MSERERLRPVEDQRRGPADRRVAVPTDWPDGRQYVEGQLHKLWVAVDAVREPMDRIADSVERLEAFAKRWRKFEALVLTTVITGVMGVGFYLTGQYLKGALMPAPVAVQDARQAARDAILDVAASIGSEGRVQGSGRRSGWPTVAALNVRLREIDPSHPTVDALDRDMACQSAPGVCGR